MLFSVIVPVYNVEKYLKECINSILGQTYRDFELILVDDGSVDDSGTICDEYAKKDTRVKVIHQQNAGQAVARNTGTNIAKGEYIVYIDSDDYVCDKEFLSKLSEKAKCKTDVILYGYKKYFESSKSFGKEVCKYPALKDKSSENVLRLLLTSDMHSGCAWNKTIRRQCLVDNNIMFIPGLISEDNDWFLQVVTKAKSYDNINEAFIVYRQRQGSISHDIKIKSLEDNISIIENWNEKIDKMEESVELKNTFKSILARYVSQAILLFVRYKKTETKEHYIRLKKLKYLLKYSLTKRARRIKILCRILGFKITIKVIRLISKVKGVA